MRRPIAIITALFVWFCSSLSLGEEPAQSSAESPAPELKETKAERAAAKAAEYKPPFPDREDIFQAPNQKGLTKSQREEVRLEVVLKGFAQVDGEKALLTINGKMASLGVGETSAGVEIISIQPPQVRLKRGRVYWTETLSGANDSAPRSALSSPQTKPDQATADPLPAAPVVDADGE